MVSIVDSERPPVKPAVMQCETDSDVVGYCQLLELAAGSEGRSERLAKA